MTTTRIPGKRGRIKGKINGIPKVRHYSSRGPATRVPTYPVDETSGITDWQMLGNGPDPTLTVNNGNPVGDCTFAGREHLKRAKAAWYKIVEAWETTNQLVTEYLVYNHGQDIGANIPTLLLTWYRDGKIEGFGELDHTDATEIDWAVQSFHGVYCGVDLTDDADQLFSDHQPWTISNGESPDPSDGHCIVKIGSTTDLDTYITWGALQTATKGWTVSCLDEAYAIITAEDAKASNINLTALKADLDAFIDEHGGAILPSTPPVEAPTPLLISRIVTWVRRVF